MLSRVALSLIFAISLGGCERQPLMVGNGVAFGGRLDTVYVLRGDAVEQVGTSVGENVVGATPTDELYNAQGRPLGGGAIAAVFEGTLPTMLPTDGGGGDGGVDGGDDAALDDAGNPIPDLGEPIDLANVELSANDDMGAPDGGGPAQPTGPQMNSATPRVRLLDWLLANFEFRATPVDNARYEVRIKGDHLVPNGLYTAWVQYLISLPNPILYAIAPLGGLPTAFIADEEGVVDVTWRVSARMFEQLQSIPNPIAVGNSGIPTVITPVTTVVVTLMYHSNGQLNGNASIPADPSPNGLKPDTENVPGGTIGIPGHVGVDVHPHVSTFPMATVPRQSP